MFSEYEMDLVSEKYLREEKEEQNVWKCEKMLFSFWSD